MQFTTDFEWWRKCRPAPHAPAVDYDMLKRVCRRVSKIAIPLLHGCGNILSEEDTTHDELLVALMHTGFFPIERSDKDQPFVDRNRRSDPIPISVSASFLDPPPTNERELFHSVCEILRMSIRQWIDNRAALAPVNRLHSEK